ncbi:hypothetical protein ACKFKG_14615 [Phormidesmis sp. 146-35]
MLKKACVVSLLSVAALGMISLPSKAGQVQESVQGTSQSAAIVGDGNVVNQYIIQNNVQKQRGQGHLKGKKQQQQGSFQGAGQTAGVVGNGNQLNQVSEQLNVQQQKLRSRGHKQRYFRGDKD